MTRQIIFFIGNDMKILDELYGGNIRPNKKIELSPKDIELTKDLLKIHREISALLPPEKQELMAIYEKISNEITQSVAQKKFIEGYKLGSRIMLEALENKNT